MHPPQYCSQYCCVPSGGILAIAFPPSLLPSAHPLPWQCSQPLLSSLATTKCGCWSFLCPSDPAAHRGAQRLCHEGHSPALLLVPLCSPLPKFHNTWSSCLSLVALPSCPAKFRKGSKACRIEWKTKSSLKKKSLGN